MYQTSPVNPALASLLEVANMVTPEQTPTVAAQLAGAAGAPVMPPQGMPQGAPQGMPPQGMQNAMRQAQTGAQIQQMQQQEQQQAMQQAMQQMMQQRQAQEQAMRFGVAAAPGAQSIRMAEGGIVGYAGGGPSLHDLNDPEKLKKILEQLKAKRDAEKVLSTPAATGASAATKQGILRALLGKTPIGKLLTLGSLGATAYGLFGGDEEPKASTAPAVDDGTTPAVQSEIDRMARAEAGAPARPAAGGPSAGGPSAGGAAQPAGAAPVSQTGIASTLAAAPYFQRQREELGKYNAEIPTGQEAVTRAAQNKQALDALMRARGLNPERYKEQIAQSDARRARQEEALADQVRRYEEDTGGIRGLMRFAAAGANKVYPGGLGRDYIAMQDQERAQRAEFGRAREQIKLLSEQYNESIMNAEYAKAEGDMKTAREELEKARNAKNSLVVLRAEMEGSQGKGIQEGVDRELDRRNRELTTRLAVQGRSDVAGIRAQGGGRSGELTTRDKLRVQAELNRDLTYRNAATTLSRLSQLPNPTPEQIKLMERQQKIMQDAEDKILQRLGIASGGGGGAAPKIMTMADVRATAKAQRIPEQKVIDDAKAAGFTIR